MRTTLLGTGSPIPDARRAGPSSLVTDDQLCVLIDCGRGVVMRLVGAGVLPPMLDALLLTHLHSDHISDLGDVITTRWVMSPGPRPLKIVGPPGTRAVVDATLASLTPDIGYRIEHHDDLSAGPVVEVTEVQPGDVFTVGTDGATTVRVAATDHRPVHPTVAFRVEHNGQSVVLAGDGVPCAALDQILVGADVYVQSVIRDDLVRMVPSARLQDILDYHSTVQQAGQTAQRAGVGTLMLTHYVPAMQPGDEDQWKGLAAAHFDGRIVLGDDLTSVEL